MSLVINTNQLTKAMGDQQNTNQALMANSMNRLSSGLRTNRAIDDAAGFAIESPIQVNISASSKILANTNNANSTQDNVGNMVQQLEGSARQAADNSLSDKDLHDLNATFTQMKQEIDRVAKSYAFNGQALPQTDLTTSVQAGTQSSSTTNRSGSKISTQAPGLAGTTLTTANGATSSIGALNEAVKSMGAQRSSLGALMNKLNSTMNGLSPTPINLPNATASIKDSDVAQVTADLTRGQILQQPGIAMLAIANTNASSVMSLLHS